jgi:hypothetical protein
MVAGTSYYWKRKALLPENRNRHMIQLSYSLPTQEHSREDGREDGRRKLRKQEETAVFRA